MDKIIDSLDYRGRKILKKKSRLERKMTKHVVQKSFRVVKENKTKKTLKTTV